jgi:hypothetical protein
LKQLNKKVQAQKQKGHFIVPREIKAKKFEKQDKFDKV